MWWFRAGVRRGFAGTISQYDRIVHDRFRGCGVLELNDITGQVMGAALRIHSALGPGVMESVYEMILARDLERRALRVERNKAITFEFEGLHFENAFRTDLVVDGRVIVEVKAVSELAPVHGRQLLTYLRLLNCPVGLLINFGALHLRDGIRRVYNFQHVAKIDSPPAAFL